MKKSLRKATGDRIAGDRLPLPRQWQGNFGISGLLGVNLPGTHIDWERQAGDLSLNSIVASCLGWITRNWPQAQPTVVRQTKDNENDPVDHPLNMLLQRPHPNYSGAMLAQMSLQDWWTRGNAYWHVVRAGRGEGIPVELHYMPARCMWPVSSDDGSSIIDHYLYRPDGRIFEIANSDIIHFRHGLDPHNLLVGRNPLASGLREIVTDNEGSTYGAAMLMNSGVPPIVISPKQSAQGAPVQPLTLEQSRKIKRDFQDRTTSDKRGEPMVLSAAIELIKMSFSPKEMATDEIRRKPEERICSLFGISPMVVDLGAGLENSTYSNKTQAEQAAVLNCLVPTWQYFAAEMTVQLLPLYGEVSDDIAVWYNLSKVAALQDDLNAKSARLVAEFEGNIAKRSEAREALGYDVDEATDDAYASDIGAPAPSAEDEPVDGPIPEDAKKKDAGVARIRTKKPIAELSALYRAAETFRAALAQHEDGAVSAMEAAYNAAQSAIMEKAEMLDKRVQEAAAEGQTVSAEWLSQQERYHALLAQIDASLAALADEQVEPLAKSQMAAAEAGAAETELLANAAAGKPPKGVSLSWNRLPTEALQTFVGLASNGSPLSDLLKGLGPAASQSVRDALATGIAAGKGPRGIADQIADALGGNKARALTIARTETLRAARMAAVKTFQKNADVVEGWVWLSAQDDRTCASCWAMSGTFHGSDETLDSHPNCRCTPTPRTKSWAEMTGDASLPDTRPNIPPGAEGFAKLPPTKQEAILGPALHALYQSGAVKLEDCVQQDYDPRWGTMRRQATVAEAEANAAARAT